MKELGIIQATLKVPKSLRSTFGNYNYRSCESILEAVKPLLMEQGCKLILTDRVINVGDRYYVEATATIINDKGEIMSATAVAREEETKKGMDVAQITGAASSYARKYALNGLFAIDDTKDPDTDEHYTRTHTDEQPKQANPKPRRTITLDTLYNDTQRISLYEWCFKKFVERGYPNDFDSVQQLRMGYDIDDEVAEVFRNGYATYHTQKLTPKA